MAPCSADDIDINIPTISTASPIKGFGIPHVLKVPDIAPYPSGFPEDLLDLFDKFSFLVPPGVIKPNLNPNFSKDIFDSIMSMLDQFFPFLMLYKFFLPVLNLIICIIEVLCSLLNPFKLRRALRRLFRRCIPEFLNLFPIFAMIIMLISLLLLIVSLVEYIISQIEKLVDALLRNIKALEKAFQNNDQNSVLAIAKKLGSLLCIFQNLFVLLAVFNTIIEVIRNVLRLAFKLPPCDDTTSGDADGCCTPDVCPSIVKSVYTRETGTLAYTTEGIYRQSVVGMSFDTVVRPELWQIYDTSQEQPQEFINIVDAYDVTNMNPKPIFFPTDSVYNASTAPGQAAYTVDLRLFYNPTSWGRTGDARYIRFTNCIVTSVPTRSVLNPDNTNSGINTGVLTLAGGLGYEDDGTTALSGYAPNGVTPVANQATLENFLHKPDVIGENTSPIYISPSDGYVFSDVTYTFNPVLETLLSKNLITAGCDPDLAADRNFVNSVFAGDIGVKTSLVNDLLSSSNPNQPGFPDPNATQECLTAALNALRANLSVEGVAQFQATTTLCLTKLKDDANKSIKDLIEIGFAACSSTFTLEPKVQFTSKPIKVSVYLKDNNGLALTAGLSNSVASELALKITAHPTVGTISPFKYDGYSAFTADLTSESPGKGQLMISFDNNTFCTNNIPEDLDQPATHDLQILDYTFVYTPNSASGSLVDGVLYPDGQPRRDEGDLARAGGDSTKRGD